MMLLQSVQLPSVSGADSKLDHIADSDYAEYTSQSSDFDF